MTASRFTAAAILLVASTAAAQVTDRGSYPEPPLPPLPPAGGTFVDPTFGTTVLRVTDAGTSAGASCGTAYSYWPTFNRTSTRLWAFCDEGNRGVLFDFDPDSLALSAGRPLFAGPPPGGDRLSVEDAIWSGVDPDVVLVHDTLRLWAYDVVTTSYTLLKDFSSLQPNLLLHQMSVSRDDDVLAFTKRNDATFAVTGYVAYRRSTDSFPVNEAVTRLDEVQVDKTGRWLMVKTGQNGLHAIQNLTIDMTTGAVESLTDGAPDFGPGHSDNGRGVVIGADDWNNQLTGRSFATPHTFSTVLAYGDDWTQDAHISMLADDERWITVTSHDGGPRASTWGPLHDEVYQVTTDGTQRLRRLAHHRSRYRSYWDSPRGNVSRDGRFVAFTSNWGGSKRHDLFVVVAPATGLCGDGTLDIGEACDDGNLVDGDGCDSNCTPTACGNHVVTTGEQCDDGNLAAGDCCSPSCTFESAGAACTDPNPCTQNDQCDGAGTCGGQPEPRVDCRTSAAGLVAIKGGKTSSLTWRWSSGATPLADFGDPIGGTTRYTLCVYDEAAGVSALRLRAGFRTGACLGRPCWTSRGGSGLAYRDKEALPDGVVQGTFQAGGTGAAFFSIKAKGRNLVPPPLPFAQDGAVTVQLQHSGGACWSTVLDAPAIRNDGRQFKDRF
jgi:cysteine-rich repeat protein